MIVECPGCGAANMDGASTCWECGSSMSSTSERSARAWVLWVFVGLVALAVVGIMLSANSGLAGGGGAPVGQPTGTVEATGAPGGVGSSSATQSQEASPAP